MSAPVVLSRERIEELRRLEPSSYTEHRALCDMALRAEAAERDRDRLREALRTLNRFDLHSSRDGYADGDFDSQSFNQAIREMEAALSTATTQGEQNDG